MNSAYNPNNTLQRTANNGAVPRHEGDTGSVETFWPCVGELRIVPDFNSLYPTAGQQAPFAGATRPLCDRKEIRLGDQMTALAKFYLFSSAHVASHFTGTITNDFASEFDPYSPQFGEKFAVPNVPVAVKDPTRQGDLARLCGPVGHLQRPDLLELDGVPAEPERLHTDDDDHVHERPRPDTGSGASRPDDDRPELQPGVQQLLLRDSVHARADVLPGHAGRPGHGVRRGLQPARLRISGHDAGDQDGGQLRRVRAARPVGPAGDAGGGREQDSHTDERQRRRHDQFGECECGDACGSDIDWRHDHLQYGVDVPGRNQQRRTERP